MENNYYLYMHIFPNDKRYIGITKQLPKERWKNGSGYSGQTYMYNAIKKYGWENIQHIILKENLSQQEALEQEEYYITYYKTLYNENGYNIARKGNLPPSAEKQVSQYTLSGDFIATYINTLTAGRETKVDTTDIAQAIKGKRKTAGGFQWRIGNDTKSIGPVKYDNSKGPRKKIDTYLNNTYINTYDSISAAARASGVNRSTVTSILKNPNLTTKNGYSWKYSLL